MALLLHRPTGCTACKDGIDEPFPFSMAFQPIVNTKTGSVFAYEALCRGSNGESAFSVLSQVTEENRYAFDQSCRVKAITLASELGLADNGAMLSINFMPGAVYNPAACIQVTLKTARKLSFPLDRLIFEIVEAEKVKNIQHLLDIVLEYRNCGFKIALDDYGAAWSGPNLLAEIPANLLKLDMALIRDIDKRCRARAIVESTVALAQKLDVEVIAEGIETVEEFKALRDCGIALMQGYLFAKPAFEALPAVLIP